ncbi:MAG: DEAD/DEAH box helicase [Desulfobacteraceae bacterium]|nr:MAG: DEAD/DEAH box helicase [Desulfobacteraceae bacterium]
MTSLHNPETYQHLEFHRNAAALIPEAKDDDPGVAVMVRSEKTETASFTCNCRNYRGRKTCNHIKILRAMIKAGDVLEEDRRFRKSAWYQMAGVLNDLCRLNPSDILVERPDPEDAGKDEALLIRMGDPHGKRVEYTCSGRFPEGKEIPENRLLLERCGVGEGLIGPFHRGGVLTFLHRMTWTETEQQMVLRNAKTRRQVLEESFWFRLFYHCMRVSQGNGPAAEGRVDETDGQACLVCRVENGPMLQIFLPRDHASQIFSQLGGCLGNRDQFILHPHPLTMIVKVSADAKNRLILRLCLLWKDGTGQTEVIDYRKSMPFHYGNLVYLPDKSCFAALQPAEDLIKLFGGKFIRQFKFERVPAILDQLGRDLFAPPNIIDPSVGNIRIHKQCTRIEVVPEASGENSADDPDENLAHALDRDWRYLSVHYGFGDNISVSLNDMYRAKKEKKRFLPVANGWVDVMAFDLDALTGQPGSPVLESLAAGHHRLKLSRLDVFRLRASTDQPLMISGQAAVKTDGLSDMLELKPPEAFVQPEGLGCTLREYQKRGVEWLMFLRENGFGGLLCDDMGLGKTHQIMALMVWLLEKRGVDHPFLVVCPTTVISHWQRKIEQHAPALTPVVYHGDGREFPENTLPGQVIITSYGVLMRDIDTLAGRFFGLAAFDEAQYIKNAGTKTHAAARMVQSAIPICVTGTPVENHLSDLKSLMDMALPGYLGSDDAFAFRYGLNGTSPVPRHRQELKRLIAPFTLRRMKKTVLSELPEKIEDIRFCALTGTQVRLYREAVEKKGKHLLADLRAGDKNIPYIHIFALLTLLKQICNHPATVSGALKASAGETMDSGKWNLFCELLDECLDSGQKVVVYSQFVDMVAMIAGYAKTKGVGVATLTGSTRNRGAVIDRFNADPDCRVFAGSLKDGGTGIDLTAASVVIHYDRWWNAAREDQATDRVHRIGQTRGVQVFKLVTEGTLEEKISAMISKKKQLMNDIIAEDDPGLLKTFSPDDLIDLLALPETEGAESA